MAVQAAKDTFIIIGTLLELCVGAGSVAVKTGWLTEEPVTATEISVTATGKTGRLTVRGRPPSVRP